MNDTEQLLFAVACMAGGLFVLWLAFRLYDLMVSWVYWRRTKALHEDLDDWKAAPVTVPESTVIDKDTLDRADASWAWAERERRMRQAARNPERSHMQKLRKSHQDEVSW